MLDKYWAFMVEKQYEYHLYSAKAEHLSKVRFLLGIAETALATTALVGGATFGKFPWVWGLFAVISSVLVIFGQKIFGTDGKAKLEIYLQLFDAELEKTRNDWRDMYFIHEYTNQDIADVMNGHEKTFSDLDYKFLPDENAPKNKKWVNRAAKSANTYVESFC